VKLLLLDQMIGELAFDQLHTKEQLGYIVHSGTQMAATTASLRLIIQSEQTPEFLESRIDCFLKVYGTMIHKMSQEELGCHVTTLTTTPNYETSITAKSQPHG
jgi:insulysin